MYIVTRDFDAQVHADPRRRGAYLLLVPGKTPEIVLDGLATQREQRDAQRRCEAELQSNLYVAQTINNSDQELESALRRTVVLVTQDLVITSVQDHALHDRLDRDPERRGGYLLYKPGQVPEIVLDGLATERIRKEAERRCLKELAGRRSVERLEAIYRTPKDQHPPAQANRDLLEGEDTGPLLGRRLLAVGLVSQGRLDEALRKQKGLARDTKVRRIGSLLVEMGVLGVPQLTKILAQQRGVSPLASARNRVDPPLRALFPLATMWEFQVAPLFVVGKLVTVAMVDPQDQEALAKLAKLCSYGIRPLQASQLQVVQLIESTQVPLTPSKGAEKLSR